MNKRWLAALAAAMLLVYTGLTAGAAGGADAAAPTGDVNGDGVIDSTDARLILQHEVGLVTLTPAQVARADMDGDGGADSTDARLMLQLEVSLWGPRAWSAQVEESGGDAVGFKQVLYGGGIGAEKYENSLRLYAARSPQELRAVLPGVSAETCDSVDFAGNVAVVVRRTIGDYAARTRISGVSREGDRLVVHTATAWQYYGLPAFGSWQMVLQISREDFAGVQELAFTHKDVCLYDPEAAHEDMDFAGQSALMQAWLEGEPVTEYIRKPAPPAPAISVKGNELLTVETCAALGGIGLTGLRLYGWYNGMPFAVDEDTDIDALNLSRSYLITELFAKEELSADLTWEGVIIKEGQRFPLTFAVNKDPYTAGDLGSRWELRADPAAYGGYAEEYAKPVKDVTVELTLRQGGQTVEITADLEIHIAW